MDLQPASQAQVSDLADRLARIERMQEERDAKTNIALALAVGAVAVTALGARAASRNLRGGWIKVPEGNSVVTMPAAYQHQNR